MEQIKPNIANIYLKTTTILTMEAYLIFQKVKNLPSLNLLKI